MSGVRILIISSIILMLTAAVPALAQEEPPVRVGRVSLVSGTVSLRAQAAQWMPAAPGYPIAAGQSLRTGGQSGAELRIGAMTIVLSNTTELDIAGLSDGVARLGVSQGRIAIDLRQLGDGESVEIDIPRGGVWLLQPGQYDISAGDAEQPAHVAAFAGAARFVGGQLDTVVEAGNAAVLSGSDPIVATNETAAADSLIEGLRSRPVDETQLEAPLHISRDTTGYEELDAHGSWDIVADYGAVWYPSAAPTDWAPYRFGHWSWLAPWGWTWIDDQPWGFAPSHYGRWAWLGERWGWVPGSFVSHPAYAPAVVAFLGTPGVGLSFP